MYGQNISYTLVPCSLINTGLMQKADVSPVEQYVIDRVREMRIERGISQRDLAYQLDISSGFIGDVETVKSRAKYNINQLNEIAKIFKCSIKDFLPDEPI